MGEVVDQASAGSSPMSFPIIHLLEICQLLSGSISSTLACPEETFHLHPADLADIIEDLTS